MRDTTPQAAVSCATVPIEAAQAQAEAVAEAPLAAKLRPAIPKRSPAEMPTLAAIGLKAVVLDLLPHPRMTSW